MKSINYRDVWEEAEKALRTDDKFKSATRLQQILMIDIKANAIIHAKLDIGNDVPKNVNIKAEQLIKDRTVVSQQMKVLIKKRVQLVVQFNELSKELDKIIATGNERRRRKGNK